MKKYYELKSWKLTTFGEFTSEKRAIRSLANTYLKCSKCDAIHPIFYLNGGDAENLSIEKQQEFIDNAGKVVSLYVREVNNYGIEQLMLKSNLIIRPFSKKHWWDFEKIPNDLILPTKFKYEIQK